MGHSTHLPTTLRFPHITNALLADHPDVFEQFGLDPKTSDKHDIAVFLAEDIRKDFKWLARQLKKGKRVTFSAKQLVVTGSSPAKGNIIKNYVSPIVATWRSEGGLPYIKTAAGDVICYFQAVGSEPSFDE